MTATPTSPPAGKIKLKNTLNQTVPVQLFDGDGKICQRNLTRKETFEIAESSITPALQAQIDSKILKVRKK